MTIDVAARALAVWLAIAIVAIGNGVLREAVLVPRFGAAPALVLSGALLALLIVATATLCLPWLGVHAPGQLVLIGAGWVVLTVIFEFSLGLLRGQSLAEIGAAYTFAGGNLWPAVLLITAAAPWLASRLRGWP